MKRCVSGGLETPIFGWKPAYPVRLETLSREQVLVRLMPGLFARQLMLLFLHLGPIGKSVRKKFDTIIA